MNRYILPVALLSFVLCSGFVCNPYHGAVQAGDDIASSITQGMKTVDQIRQQGLISQTEEGRVLDYLEFANTSDKAYLGCVAVAHTNGNKAGTYTACIQTFNQAINNPTTLALIKVGNANGQNQVNAVVNGITAAVSAVQAALGGK